MNKTLSNLLIFVGVILLIITGFQYWERNNPQRLSFDIKSDTIGSNTGSENTYLKPATLVIPSLNLDLPIFPAEIKFNRWESTKKGVSYLINTPIPGEIGNSIIYGHNWSNLLGGLPQVKPGQDLFVTYSDGSKKHFIVEYTQVVGPNDSSILKPTTDRRITLYTCTGFLDTKRFVVIAIYK